MSEKLKPCPFCGSTEIDADGWVSNGGATGPECCDCGATAMSVHDWNRRVHAPAPASDGPGPSSTAYDESGYAKEPSQTRKKCCHKTVFSHCDDCPYVPVEKCNCSTCNGNRNSWFCESCKVEVYQTRCKHCGKLEHERT